MSTRREHITEEMRLRGESWDDIEHVVIGRNRYAECEPSLDREFEDGFGCENGDPFTLWTHKRVYFPAVYDGSEWVASVPRNPCDEVVEPVGG